MKKYYNEIKNTIETAGFKVAAIGTGYPSYSTEEKSLSRKETIATPIGTPSVNVIFTPSKENLGKILSKFVLIMSDGTILHVRMRNLLMVKSDLVAMTDASNILIFNDPETEYYIDGLKGLMKNITVKYNPFKMAGKSLLDLIEKRIKSSSEKNLDSYKQKFLNEMRSLRELLKMYSNIEVEFLEKNKNLTIQEINLDKVKELRIGCEELFKNSPSRYTGHTDEKQFNKDFDEKIYSLVVENSIAKKKT